MLCWLVAQPISISPPIPVALELLKIAPCPTGHHLYLGRRDRANVEIVISGLVSVHDRVGRHIDVADQHTISVKIVKDLALLVIKGERLYVQ
jgi:hypothetical protein